MPRLLCLALSLTLFPWAPSAAVAQDNAAEEAGDVLAGHSAHGEAFNEGPRQAAYLMGTTGDVHLKVTTKDPQAQEFFDQGVGQLHGFWYFEAERSFRQAAALDPDCAMAYWGMAMANFSNSSRSKGFIAEAVERKDAASARERLWIEGLNEYLTSTKDNKTRWRAYIRSLENLLFEHPDELEARAFLAWALYTSNRKGLPFSSHMSVDAVIQDVLDEQPMHPVHHYRIHLWDHEKPERAVASSARCGQGSPGIAHMWHMPGHIYWRLKRYHDSAWQQEASARVDHAHMVRDRVMPYRIHNYAHNNEWLTRSLSHVGRTGDAVDLAKNMIELPRHPKKNRLSSRGSGAYYGRLRLLEVLNRYELWEQTIRLCNSAWLEPTDIAEQQVKRLHALGVAYVETGDTENAAATIDDLEKRLEEQQRKRDEAGAKAEEKAREAKKSDKDIRKAGADARRKFASEIRSLENALKELRARKAFAEGEREASLQALAKTSGLLKEHLSRFYLEAGDKEKAEQLARQAKDAADNQVYPLANYVEALYRVGKPAEALKEFERLRTLGGEADLSAPIFRRLSEVADALNLPEDWRLPRETPEDLQPRPDLAELGPFRWRPSPAPDWTLPGSGEAPVSLADYRSRPVIVIFYLGYGCLHCAQQLEKFGPQADKFQEAGIDLVAISSDAAPDLRKSHEQYCNETDPPREFPFPLAADAELKVFRQYRCYDDFEQTPLHGTFLIDAEGLIRWQDISYEPFMEPEFLLEESKRLLAQKQDDFSAADESPSADNSSPSASGGR